MTILGLLEEPFGPYIDDQILSPSFHTSTVIPSLRAVKMWCGGDCIGFDETEVLVKAEHGSRISQHPVHVFGNLIIQSLDWLSDQGKRLLQKELRERDKEQHGSKFVSGLTLESLYGKSRSEGSCVTVRIKIDKNMNAEFLTSQKHPEALVIHSRDRIFKILTVDALLFEGSQNFFSRFRLLALINEIIALDSNQTPVEQRTIDWLVDQYLSSAFRNRDLHRRLIQHPDDSDTEDGITRDRRHLRFLHRSEIRGAFAEQCEWLFAYMLVPTHKNLWKVNMVEWLKFCNEVRKGRAASHQLGMRWGMPPGALYGPRTTGPAIDLVQFGHTEEFWKKKIKIVMEPKPTKQKPQIRSKTPFSESIPQFVYDSDFSEDSTSGESESDSAESIDGNLIPSFCYQAPELPAGSFIWHCPGKCKYSIDLLHLKEENTVGLSHDTVQGLLAQSWASIKEGPVQQSLAYMVDTHYQQHLRDVGVELVRKNGKYFAQKWPPVVKQRHSKQRKVPRVKTEGHGASF